MKKYKNIQSQKYSPPHSITTINPAAIGAPNTIESPIPLT